MTDTCHACGVPAAESDHDRMGTYVEGRKLGSVGIRVAEGVTMHGIGLNRDPDLEWFRIMSACGAPDVVATSIAAEGGDPDRGRAEAHLARALTRYLDLETQEGRHPG
jgi:lipoate-protein ligase B